MKKMLYCSILAIAFSSFLFAKKRIVNPLTKPQHQISGNVLVISDITVFPQPNYQGKSGFFSLVDGRIVAPFPVSNCSFTKPVGKIIYIKRCDTGFPGENAFTGPQASINLEGICGIRSDDAGIVSVQFSGISTIIHNNDCRRIFGSIKIKIIENAPGTNPAMSTMAFTSRDNYKGTDFGTFLPFNNANANTSPGYTNHVLDEGHFRLTTLGIVGNSTVGNAVANFWVGKNALREGRVSIVITSDIGSAHKTCDLCLDFSSNVRMRAPVTEVLPLNHSDGRIIDATHNRLIVGPYEAYGLAEHSPAASGNGINILFRAHLTLVGL